MQADAKINKKAAQRRSIAAAAAAEHTTACIVEFSSLSGIKPPTSFLGWFPPVDKRNNRMEEAPYECLQLRLGMDMDVKAAKKKADSSDDSDDDEDDDDDESGILNDWHEDEDDDSVDLDHPKRPAPLLWLRFPLHTVPPMGVPRDVGDNELVHLLMPAYVFLPEKKPAADNNSKSNAAIGAGADTAASKPVSRSSSFASSSSSSSSNTNNAGSTASKNYPTPTSAPESDDDGDNEVGHGIAAGSVKLTRYTTAYTRTGYQPPLYIRQAAAESGIDPHALCYMDIQLASTRPGAVAAMPARVMKLRSAVENVLKGDVRDVGECLHLRVHAVWSRKLADAVEAFGRRVERRAAKAVREGGVGGGGGKVQEKRERERLMRAGALALPGEERVGVEAWDNFVKWKPVRGGMRRMKCDHKLSTTVEKMGLVEKSGWESSDESEAEVIFMEKKSAKRKKADVGAGVKKQKVSHGDGADSLVKFSGGKASAKDKGSKA